MASYHCIQCCLNKPPFHECVGGTGVSKLPWTLLLGVWTSYQEGQLTFWWGCCHLGRPLAGRQGLPPQARWTSGTQCYLSFGGSRVWFIERRSLSNHCILNKSSCPLGNLQGCTGRNQLCASKTGLVFKCILSSQARSLENLERTVSLFLRTQFKHKVVINLVKNSSAQPPAIRWNVLAMSSCLIELTKVCTATNYQSSHVENSIRDLLDTFTSSIVMKEKVTSNRATANKFRWSICCLPQ